MSPSPASEKVPEVSRNQLVRDFLKAAGDRLDAIQAGSEADEADVELIWAIRDVRWAVHHLLEIVEAYRDAS